MTTLIEPENKAALLLESGIMALVFLTNFFAKSIEFPSRSKGEPASDNQVMYLYEAI